MIKELKLFLKLNNYSMKGIENHFKDLALCIVTGDYRSGIIKINGLQYSIYCIKPFLIDSNGLIEVTPIFS